VAGQQLLATGWITVGMSEPTGRKAVPLSSTEATGVHCVDHRFVVTVVSVRLDVSDQSTVVSSPVVGPDCGLVDNDQEAPGFAVDDEFARLESVVLTERGRVVDRGDCVCATDSTDVLPHACRWNPSGGGLDSHPAEMFAPCPADGVVRAGTLVVVGVDNVGAAVGFDDDASIAERTDRHRLGSGASRAIAGPSFREMGLRRQSTGWLLEVGCLGAHWRAPDELL